MAQVINTNIMSMNAQRNLNTSQSSLATSLQRLSSGLRINSAKDDAAGLAISERFTTQIRGLNQAIRNSNDGISLAQTGEGALSEITQNLQRIRELAVQSANATNSDSDRAALQLEVDQRLAEIDRIASQTSFNGRRILDGSFGSAQFQVGANVGETIGVNLEGSMKLDSIGTAASATSADLTDVFTKSVTGGALTGALGAGDLTINETEIVASQDAAAIAGQINALTTVTATATESSTGTDYNSFATLSSGGVDDTYVLSIEGVEVANVDTSVTTVDAAYIDGRLADGTISAALTAAGVTVAGTAAGNNLVLSKADGSTLDIAQTFGADITGNGFHAAAATDTYYGTVDLESDSAIVIGGDNAGNAGFTAGTYGAIDLAADDFTIAVGAADAVGITGTFASGDELAAAINAAANGVVASFDATTNKLLLQSSEDITLGGIEALDAVDAEGSVSGLGFASLNNAAGGDLVGASVIDVASSNDTIFRVDAALTSVSNLRSTFGAIQNRFESTITNLSTTAENLSAARSRIQDADFAAETANLTRAQILQQAGTAILAQANALPQNVLSLLG